MVRRRERDSAYSRRRMDRHFCNLRNGKRQVPSVFLMNWHGTQAASAVAMKAPYRDRIDFISAYCDRWCERCAFTTRCSDYAVTVATAMCGGDFRAGIELAVGAPPPMTPEEEKRRQAFIEEISSHEPTQAELDEIGREEAARDERVDDHPLVTACKKFGLPAHSWLRDHDHLAFAPETPAATALEVIRRDEFFIQVKLRRALLGLDEYRLGISFREHRVQNDWNGSAKVALISIRRSIEAWELVAAEVADPEASAIASELRVLESEVLKTFPQAWEFSRPGFDDPAAGAAVVGPR